MNAISGPFLTTVAAPLIGNSVDWQPNPASINRERSRPSIRMVRWSLWVAGRSTSGTDAQPLVPRGDVPAMGSSVGTEGPSGGSAIGSALCSRLLGGARLCSLLLGSDLGGWEEALVGGVVVTILTSEGALVRTQVRPPSGQSVGGERRRGLATGEHSLPGEAGRVWRALVLINPASCADCAV